MKGFCERAVASKCSPKCSSDLNHSTDRGPSCVSSDSGSRDSKQAKASLWSNIFSSALSIFETHSESSTTESKALHSRNHGWTAAVRKVVTGGSMRRIHERLLGSSRTGICSTSDIWLLGVHYKFPQDESSGSAAMNDFFGAFEQDFSSRILMTYRKGLLNGNLHFLTLAYVFFLIRTCNYLFFSRV